MYLRGAKFVRQQGVKLNGRIKIQAAQWTLVGPSISEVGMEEGGLATGMEGGRKRGCGCGGWRWEIEGVRMERVVRVWCVGVR
jgi:hypothetical protein